MFVYEARFGIKGNNAHALGIRLGPRWSPAFKKDCALKGTSRVFIRAISPFEERRNCESEPTDFTPRRGGKMYPSLGSIFFEELEEVRARFARD